MHSTVLHVSLSSPDAIAAVKVSESCLANSWILVVRRGASAGEGVSIEKDGAHVLEESQSDGANNPQCARTTPNCQRDRRSNVQDHDI